MECVRRRKWCHQVCTYVISILKQLLTYYRPFGNNIVDGFDLDLELANGNQYFIPFLNTLRSNFASDPNHNYVITGAPVS